MKLKETEQSTILTYFTAVVKSLRRMDRETRARQLAHYAKLATEYDKIATPKAGGRKPKKDRRK